MTGPVALVAAESYIVRGREGRRLGEVRPAVARWTWHCDCGATSIGQKARVWLYAFARTAEWRLREHAWACKGGARP